MDEKYPTQEESIGTGQNMGETFRKRDAAETIKEAGPVLLDACLKALEWFEHPEVYNEQDVMDHLHIAISKARGIPAFGDES